MAPSAAKVDGELTASTSAQANGTNRKDVKKKEKKDKGAKKKGKSSLQKTTQETDKKLVEELKLFQNHKLLNQQDPMHLLQQQLGQILENDKSPVKSSKPAKTNGLSKKHKELLRKQLPNDREIQFSLAVEPKNADNQLELTATSANHSDSTGQAMIQTSNEQRPISIGDNNSNANCSITENVSTIKKGVLWQQQQYEKFHQRLFSRWKKRYFILTTDYLVCFKRSLSKVGRSEMGQFLYKTSLNDIVKIDWLKPDKSDKGAIVLHIVGNFNLLLWNKRELDDWMFVIGEAIERHKIRKMCLMNPNVTKQNSENDHLKLKRQSESIEAQDSFQNTAKITNAQSKDAGEQEESGSSVETAPVGSSDANITTVASDDKEEPASEVRQNRSKDGSLDPPSLPCHPHDSHQGFDKVINHSSDNNLEGQQQNQDRASSGGSRTSFKGLASEPKKVSSGEPLKLERNDLSSDPRAQANNVEASSSIRSISSSTSSAAVPSASNHSAASSRASTRGGSGSGSKRTTDQSAESKRRPSLRRRQSSDSGSGHNSYNSTSTSTSSSLMKEKNLVRASKRKTSADNKVVLGDEETTMGLDENKEVNRNRSEPTEDRNRETNSKPTAKDNNDSLTNGSRGFEAITGVRSRGEAAAVANKSMIRRDDSWQSLVSLTRLGRLNPPEVGQRSSQGLRPIQQHPHEEGHLRDRKLAEDNGAQFASPTSNKQIISLGESSATPSRMLRAAQQGSPLLARHQSVQAARNFRPHLLEQRQHPISASFDVAPTNCNDFLQADLSHRQKLLQLQLMHNSNNVERLRHANPGEEHYGQAIYNDSGAASNHYGYSSMRSNLKSAASEFSFIRPSPSNYVQSTLPHQPKQAFGQGDAKMAARMQNRNSLILGQTGQPAFKHQQQYLSERNANLDIKLNCPPSGSPMPFSQQYLVHPVTGERLSQQEEEEEKQACPLSPPMRELPLKPNKKRESQPKKASLTSAISLFFRRAFSRRSSRKQKSRAKMEDSCSIGALAVDCPLILATGGAPSAFSTGGKSALAAERAVVQTDRMIDMIEAFASKHSTGLAKGPATQTGSNLELMAELQRPQEPQRRSQLGQQPALSQTPLQMRKAAPNAFGSPLHKSNSISTSMGFSQTDELPGKLNFQYDNAQLNAMHQRDPAGASSPMPMRSGRVSSANLTPLMSQRTHHNQVGQQSQAFMLSPRVVSRRSEGASGGLPRPSSIYGQPSMISSPSSSGAINRELSVGGHFGVHRNSLHNQFYQPRERNLSQPVAPEAVKPMPRHHHQMSGFQQLDTTREVAEELSSPVEEKLAEHFAANKCRESDLMGSPQIGRYSSMRTNIEGVSKHLTSSPSSGRLQQHRQAIVNPILQSPTMDAIYDNHPVASGELGLSSAQAYSHYDNHSQLLMERHQHQSHMQASPSIRSKVAIQFATPSHQPSASIAKHNQSKFISTPSRFSGRLQAAEEAARNKDWSNFDHYRHKPAAIVGPSIIASDNNGNWLSNQPERIHNHYQQEMANPSPLMSRRNNSNYQPSLNHQSRMLAEGAEAVVNIAGAPGINLEPSLAASLLRGTNINAYESSTFDRLSNLNHSNKSNRKTFLVSTRLSKSMANQQANGIRNNGNNSPSEQSDESASGSGYGMSGKRNWITSKLNEDND